MLRSARASAHGLTSRARYWPANLIQKHTKTLRRIRSTSPACGARAPSLHSSLKLDALATDKVCEGPASPSLCASLVMGEPPFAHPEGCFALLHSALAGHLRRAIRQQPDAARPVLPTPSGR
jgi:hypothetical protein